ncbi:KAP family P-loop domain-containing protein [Geodermatophilus siccatus]|uniref:KAP family P-loop domain-containing protein n=1 Tax=Geodermatophilus siccatus TaxID=1137991 RepID=A0A1G9RYV9_9ACTN|nr:P-loop NTPase fold protein [Geodermatophilus siccatus]SDM28217.1 KAP family P-loop domain-containing protein [Geodermatophilus siccatus]
MNYSSFRILLDTPAKAPGLGFTHYAEALAEVVSESPARFAVGIFGDWGAGKTTLMRAVQNLLAADSGVLTVEFNAWRYEREPDLIVPLLDIMRDRLLKLTADNDEADDDRQQMIRRAASRIARAARAILHGSTVTLKTPVVDVGLNAGAILDEWSKGAQTQAPSLQSFYHAAFKELEGAAGDFREAGLERVVVFIDDLDRCLPSQALQVLESMKLFFDLEGFVFVCGLDQDLVARAVSSKYPTPATEAVEHVSGSEYIQKIFQLPFALPRITSADLRHYNEVLLRDSDWADDQKVDYNVVVRHHLRFLVENDTVNPREVKRLINSYVIQMKILTRRLAVVDPNIVMILQLMGSRSDWRPQYLALAADPQLYVSTVLQPELADGQGVNDGAPQLPPSLYNYLNQEGRALLSVPDLGPYVLAAESTRSTDTTLITIQAALRRLRAAIADLAVNVQPQTVQAVQEQLRPLSSLGARRSGPLAARWKQQAVQLEALVEELHPNQGELPQGWSERVTRTVDQLDLIARELRSESTFGET